MIFFFKKKKKIDCLYNSYHQLPKMSSETSHDAPNGKKEVSNVSPGDIEQQARDSTLVSELPKSLGAGVSATRFRDLMMISLSNSRAVRAGSGRIRYYTHHTLFEFDGVERRYDCQCLYRQLLLHLRVWFGCDGAMGAFCRKRLFVHGLQCFRYVNMTCMA